MDLLFEAALVWQKLTNYEYHLTYGRKNILYNVNISFDNTDFFHLSGMQYLDDIQLPAISKNKYVSTILDGKLTEEIICKSHDYAVMVYPRLKALSNLETFLDNDFLTYDFDKIVLPFHTQIDSDYVAKGSAGIEQAFLFIGDRATNAQFFCRSIFLYDGNRDYSLSQKRYTLLSKIKINILTSENQIQLDKLTPKNIPQIDQQLILTDKLQQAKQKADEINQSRSVVNDKNERQKNL